MCSLHDAARGFDPHGLTWDDRLADPAGGTLVCHNDDLLDPSASTVAGYPEHPHTELEIVTWVLEGALVHTDSSGHRHVVEAGRAQVLSAGTGVRHSEVADARSGRCRFVQAWLAPSAPGTEPSYVLGEAPPSSSGLVAVAGGDGLPALTDGFQNYTPGQTDGLFGEPGVEAPPLSTVPGAPANPGS